MNLSLVLLIAAGEGHSAESGAQPADAMLAIKRFTVASGLAVELVAAEPHLANPVAFAIDEKGKFYVAETFRLSDGVSDIRGAAAWPSESIRKNAAPERIKGFGQELTDVDLAVRSVDDRIAYTKKYWAENISWTTNHSERLRLLEDRDGDGRVDHSTVFADGFGGIADGLAAGVLAWHDQVWFTCIPNLWWLRDKNGDGVADQRKSLHYGFGVRMGFIGHDLHGLRLGPDGKLYFSVGDRGARVRVPSGVLDDPDTGCVFRCNPDGSELEVFAYGLRNPQELAFDDFGNLFTGDNNSDGGDRARWVHLVEGGDSGWRIGYQFLEATETSPRARGPWNAEKMWHPQRDDQPAFIVPPVANLADGPSGVCHYPGTGLPGKYRGHFFLVDFRGQVSNSGVHSFALKPKGAGFELGITEHFLWGILATDAEFGVGGGLYVLDWVQGWAKTGKGRIYRVYDPNQAADALAIQTKQVLGQGMSKRGKAELARLLAHPDQRVRLEAQFELVSRRELAALADATTKQTNLLGRLHALWGLGQLTRSQNSRTHPITPATQKLLIGLLRDPDGEVRAQAAKVLGDSRAPEALEALTALLSDANPRVQFFAAFGLGKLGRAESVAPLFDFLGANSDADPLLRHAGVMALSWIGDVDALVRASRHPSKSVRLAALLALRRLQRPEIAEFLKDDEPAIVRETARAINDAPIESAMASLADLPSPTLSDEPLLRRILNANFRLGTAESATRLAAFAADPGTPELSRREALAALAAWPMPSGRDRVTGLWRPLIQTTRDRHTPVAALTPVVTRILGDVPDGVRVSAIRAIQALSLREAEPQVFSIVGNEAASASARSAALDALEVLRSPKLAEAVEHALKDVDEKVRAAAARIRTRIRPADALESLASVLEAGSIREKQSALETLGTLNDPAGGRLVENWLRQLVDNEAPKELALEILAAAEKQSASNPQLQTLLARYKKPVGDGDDLAEYRQTLFGGDEAAGTKIFHERADVACLKCHKVDGQGGGEVGPDLSHIASRLSREDLLRSIVHPNKTTAAGFEALLIEMDDGQFYAGTLKSEDDSVVVIESPEDGRLTLKKAQIKKRDRGLSGMPEGLADLVTRTELRDLIEYLAHRK